MGGWGSQTPAAYQTHHLLALVYLSWGGVVLSLFTGLLRAVNDGALLIPWQASGQLRLLSYEVIVLELQPSISRKVWGRKHTSI